MSTNEDWIAATGPRAVSENAEDTAIPYAVLDDPNLSLIAKGLYALVLTGQGQPINPYEDAVEDVEDIRSAIDGLVEAGLVIRVAMSCCSSRPQPHVHDVDVRLRLTAASDEEYAAFGELCKRSVTERSRLHGRYEMIAQTAASRLVHSARVSDKGAVIR